MIGGIGELPRAAPSGNRRSRDRPAENPVPGPIHQPRPDPGTARRRPDPPRPVAGKPILDPRYRIPDTSSPRTTSARPPTWSPLPLSLRGPTCTATAAGCPSSRGYSRLGGSCASWTTCWTCGRALTPRYCWCCRGLCAGDVGGRHHGRPASAAFIDPSVAGGHGRDVPPTGCCGLITPPGTIAKTRRAPSSEGSGCRRDAPSSPGTARAVTRMTSGWPAAARRWLHLSRQLGKRNGRR
jgi:hypothetical protein